MGRGRTVDESVGQVVHPRKEVSFIFMLMAGGTDCLKKGSSCGAILLSLTCP